jgi:LAO/AO transport system kinase
VLVVTKADLGEPARRAVRDLESALTALGEADTPVVAVSSVPPASGIEELREALDAHRARLDLARERARARRLSALSDFAAEHGDRGLRALGGRRAAEQLLESLDSGLDAPALLRELERRAVEEGTGSA